MKQPEFIKATGGNCGLFAILIALNALGLAISFEELEDIAIYKKATYFGELFTKDRVLTLLNGLVEVYPDIDYRIDTFNTQEDFVEKINKAFNEKKYCLLAYSALQGIVINPHNPKMTQTHWLCLYDIDKISSLISGVQSNSKANMLKVTENVKLDTLYASNKGLDKVKVNFGKYKKCDIGISKKLLETNCRCGNIYCTANINMLGTECIYDCDLAGWFLAIGRL